jgi:hypothetical protein
MTHNEASDYPEKPSGEAAQALMRLTIDETEYVLQCVDCGAYIIVTQPVAPTSDALLHAEPDE